MKPLTLKPMTYLVSFTLFVILILILGGWAAVQWMGDHFLTGGFLEAAPLRVQVVQDGPAPALHWEDKVPLPGGAYARITATSRSGSLTIAWSDLPGQPLLLPTGERVEDLRLDPSGRYLYARAFAPSGLPGKDSTWICKVDLHGRRLVRRAITSPALLPRPYRP